ncbi:MAG: nitroreductase family protein [Limnobacter sp.]|uniref:nitroreductase family protein n=1 Tax=Limnobacter sp. TaxID=2003368 RepID=UPI0022C627AD|nr:nitroreductase family protein [Limnobacter sp.]MCZ8014637.1 nitroreductase family protein [Limnobacter sp.]
MELFDAIYQRRAIKAFDPDYTISAEDEQKLFEAAIQAPTSFNIQHWRFVVVRDKALRQEMRKLGNEQAQITDASLLVIMTADMKAWEKSPARYWAGAPKEVADLLVGWMGPFHEGREWLQRDEAQRSIGMAMQTLMLAAKGLELDSCPMIGFDIEAVAKLINLPTDHVMGPMVAIGKGTKAPWPKPGQLSLNEVLINNTF